MNTIEGYKVVDDQMRSMFMQEQRPESNLAISYVLGKNEKPGSRLFAFSKLEAARFYAKAYFYRSPRIFKCIVHEPWKDQYLSRVVQDKHGFLLIKLRFQHENGIDSRLDVLGVERATITGTVLELTEEIFS